MRGRIHNYVELGSTQDEARRLLQNGQATVGDAIACERQSAGRGRFGRQWISPAGGLYATFIMESHPLISLRVAVSIADTLNRRGLEVGLKWPNDMVVGEKKVGGILVESADAVALVGVGINLANAPIATATSVRAQGVMLDRCLLLGEIMEDFAREPRCALLDAYRELSTTLGRTVRIEQRSRTIVGQAIDVDDMGQLVVATEHERCVISSGECVHLRISPLRNCS